MTATWARLLLAGISPQMLDFNPTSVYVEFVVDKVALEHGSVRVLRFTLLVSSRHCFKFIHVFVAMVT